MRLAFHHHLAALLTTVERTTINTTVPYIPPAPVWDLDQYIVDLVNNTCRLLYSANYTALRTNGTCEPPQRRLNLLQELGRLLKDAQSRFEHDSAVPPPRDIPLILAASTLPSLVSAMPSVLVSPHKWIMRNWILYHMCRVRILDVLIQHSSHAAGSAQAEGIPTGGKASQTLLSLLSGVNTSSSFLLKCTPFLLGIVTAAGTVSNCLLNDTGLLIAQYPLWMVLDSANTGLHLRDAARRFLEYIDRERNIMTTF